MKPTYLMSGASVSLKDGEPIRIKSSVMQGPDLICNDLNKKRRRNVTQRV